MNSLDEAITKLRASLVHFAELDREIQERFERCTFKLKAP